MSVPLFRIVVWQWTDLFKGKRSDLLILTDLREQAYQVGPISELEKGMTQPITANDLGAFSLCSWTVKPSPAQRR